jgi:hypothetical protein
MQSLRVSTEQVSGAAATVAGVSDQITGSAGFLSLTADAAADTPAEAACQAAAQQWGSALPAFGGAVADMAQALSAAAECYQQADRLPVAG